MTSITHATSAIKAPPVNTHRTRSLLNGLLATLADWSARRRELIALENLDNRLREDIGLPPRHDGNVNRIGVLSRGLF